MQKNNYRVKRLCDADIPKIKNLYAEYEKLHFTPIDDDFIWRVLIDGSFWGVYSGDEMLSATYTVPFESRCFDGMTAVWELEDLLGYECKKSMICGYIAGEKDNASINRAICWLWLLEGLQQGADRMIFYTPAHFYTDFDSMFKAGFCLYGLRGLDKLVPHYIFSKKCEMVSFSSEIKPDFSVPVQDTKQISKMCEKGNIAYAKTDSELLFVKGGHIFD